MPQLFFADAGALADLLLLGSPELSFDAAG